MKRYFQTVALMFDEFVNALFGGYADESISYRLALNASKGGVAGCIFCRLIQVIIPNHCDLTKPTKASGLVRNPNVAQTGV